MRGPDERTRADEYHGREAVKQSTRAAQEEFTADAALTAEPVDADLRDPSLYINRELSMLDFFERVLDEARDPHNPLLERVKFLAIVGSNLDEFFMVRIAGLQQQVEAGVTEAVRGRLHAAAAAAHRAGARLGPHEGGAPVLQRPQARARRRRHPHPRLRRAWTPGSAPRSTSYYEKQVFPVLTPLAFDPGRPFPHISNLSLNLGVLVRDANGDEHFARVKVPDTLPRLVPRAGLRRRARPARTAWSTSGSPGSSRSSPPTCATLFPGLEVVESHPFRVTRDAEIAIQELEADDLLETIEQCVRRRRFGSVVRVTIDEGMPERVRGILTENLELDDSDIYTRALAARAQQPLGGRLHRPARPQGRAARAVGPAVARRPRRRRAVRRHPARDVLLHHPYDSFDPVVEFLRAAANDPDVLAIKQTLYRVGRNSPVVEQLLEAAANGKQVAVLVELKARFDEESNIGWAKALEHEGVHVVYGLLGLKTHSKIALVVRREGERIRRYVHLGTGNYNSVTTKQYTDLGFFTADDDIGADAALSSTTSPATGRRPSTASCWWRR